MLTDGFQGSCQRQQSVGIEPADGFNVYKLRPSLCQGARLVEDEGIDTFKRFENGRVTYQDAFFRSAACTGHNRHGCGET